ncbi:hypothetical protein P7C73_g479, partial [Tremellales sp. Uapishka_1]
MSEMETKYTELSELVRITAERCRRLDEEVARQSVVSRAARSVSPAPPPTSVVSGDVTSLEELRFFRAKGIKRKRALSPENVELEKVAFQILPFLDPDSPTYTPEDVKARSPLLYYAIVAVGSREAEELAPIYDRSAQEAIALCQASVAGVVPNIYDFMGICVVITWLSPVRPPAYELDLHRSFAKLHEPGGVEAFRLWAHTNTVDALIALACGKPTLISAKVRGDLVAQAQALPYLPEARPRDFRLEEFFHGPELFDEVRSETMLHDHSAAIDAWYSKWSEVAGGRRAGVFPAADHQLYLRVSTLDDPADARYTHINVTFAAVFLLKIIKLLPNEFDEEGILAQVQKTAQLLGHVSGKSHAKTLERMLEDVQSIRAARAVESATAEVLDFVVDDDFWQWNADTGVAGFYSMT